MKLLDSNNTIERIGNITGDSQFKIKASKKAFSILSAQLYSNKILAVCREISCNAVDSHISANKSDIPIHIHLPNKLEPFFAVQDFGTGISHENIYNIYATYFESTKTETNDQTGCLGLGSKSPFSYSDSFLVTSIFEGVNRVYNAYFNEQDTPAIALMSTENTNEINGVTVQIPVEEKDFYTFANEVKNACRFFKVKPEISGGSIDWITDKITFSGEGWESYESLEHGKGYVVMGNVAYPIESYQLAYEHRQMFNHAGLVIYADMGVIDFVPSREALSYDETTKKWLNDKMAFIAIDFAEKLASSIADKDNIFDAMKAVNLIHTKFNFLKSLSMNVTFVWNGVDISSPSRLLNKEMVGLAATHYYRSFGRKKLNSSSSFSFHGKWFNDDLNRGGETRVKTYVKSQCSGDDKGAMYFSKQAYDALIAFGIPANVFTTTSTLPQPYRASSGGKAVLLPNEVRVQQLYKKQSRYTNYTWSSVTYDENDLPRFYLVKNSTYDYSFNIKSDKLRNNICNSQDLIDILKALGYDSSALFMVSAKNEHSVIDNGSVNFQTFLTDYLDNIVTFNANDIVNCRKNGSGFYHSKLTLHPSWNNISLDHPLRCFIDEVRACNYRVNNHPKIVNWMKIDETNHAPIDLVSNCPILKTIVKNIDSWNADDIMTILLALQEKDSVK